MSETGSLKLSLRTKDKDSNMPLAISSTLAKYDLMEKKDDEKRTTKDAKCPPPLDFSSGEGRSMTNEPNEESKYSNTLYASHWTSSSPTVPNGSNEESKDHSTSYVSRWTTSSSAFTPGAGDIDTSPVDLDLSTESDSDINVDDVSELPHFADDFSKNLHEKTKKLEEKLDNIEKGTTDHKERTYIMKDHLKNVRQEIDYTNNLIAAKKKEMSTERHIVALTARQVGRYEQDIHKTEDACQNERERFKSIQHQIFKENQELDTLKKSMGWNQDELERWSKETAQKEDDNLALQKYSRADEAKTKELNLMIEKLASIAVEKNAALDNEETETQACQIELERTAEAFKIQHDERRQLIKQWQETIDSMRRRDGEINSVSEKYNDARGVQNKLHTLIEEKRAEIEITEVTNDELLQQNEAAERTIQTKRQECTTLQTERLEFLDELEALRTEASAGASSVLRKRSELRNSLEDCEIKKKQLEDARRHCDDIKMGLKREKKATSTTEQTADEKEKNVEERSNEFMQMEKSIDSLKNQMFRDSQHLANLRTQEADNIAEIKSTQATSKNLDSKIHTIEAEHSRQEELLYNADFQIQLMERKVSRSLGERSDEEKNNLNARIIELESDLASKKEKRKEISQQFRKVQQEMRGWKRKKESCESERDGVHGKIDELNLEISSCESSIKQVIEKKDEVMVSHDLLRLDVRRLRDLLMVRIGEVHELEVKRHQLIYSMAERKEEIEIHSEVKMAQLRAAQDEKHKIAIELGQRRIIMGKVQSRYEILRKAHRSDGDEEHSQVYYLIMIAQQREELQREGDDLDKNIKQKEKELRAMQKTLSHLKERNSDYRQTFTKADMGSRLGKEVTSLKEKVEKSRGLLFRKKHEFQLLQMNYNKALMKGKQLNEKINESINSNTKWRDTRDKALKEIEEISKRSNNIDSEINSLSSNRRSEEKKIKAETMKQGALDILRTLTELSEGFPEVAPEISAHLNKEGLVLPPSMRLKSKVDSILTDA